MDQEIPPSSNLRADMAMMLGSFGQVPESLRQSDLWLKTHPNNARVASVLNVAAHPAPCRPARPFSLFGRGMTLLRLNDAAGSECDLGEARQRNPKIDDEVRKQGFEFVDGVLGSAEAGKDHSPASH